MADIQGIEDPRSIKLGRALRNDEAAEPYKAVVQRFPAGMVTLEDGDDGKRIHRLVKKAAADLGVKITCSWNKEKTTLYWAVRRPSVAKAAEAVEAA